MAVFSILAFAGLFDLIETRFYNPSITRSLSEEVNRDAEILSNFMNELQDRFKFSLENEAVQRSFLPNYSGQDISERDRIFDLLMESQSGIQSIRFVDAGGQHIHFSTNPADVLRQDTRTAAYRNYGEVIPYTPLEELALDAGEDPKITLDRRNDRIVFSFPFTDALEVYRGTVLYSLSMRAVTERFISAGRLRVGQTLALSSDPPGIVSGLPNTGRDRILPLVSEAWNEGLSITSLDSEISGYALVLISARTGSGIIMGRVVDLTLFDFPAAVKFILLASLFLTLYLTLFLLLNLRPDAMTVIRNRLKSLELTLIREYYERKGELDWNHWRRELALRREEVRAELKRGIKMKNSSPLMADIDTLIDKSWDEILSALGAGRETKLTIDEDRLQIVLNRALQASGVLPEIPAAPGDPVPAENFTDETPGTETPETGEPEELEELEELEVLEELEAPEELEELEELEDHEETGTAMNQGPPPLSDSAGGSGRAKKSNIQLVFGDDDIPYIVESSGLELVDDPDEVMDNIRGEEEIEELEELEGELEEPGTGYMTEPGSRDSGRAESVEDIASQIEFEHSAGEEKEDDAEDEDLEIVSPFAGMFSPFDDDEKEDVKPEAEGPPVKDPGKLEELSSGSMSLLYTPFQAGERVSPETLEPASPGEDGAIREQNGVNYVNEELKAPDPETEKKLDPGFKNLVDEVIKNQRL
ncbi:MAG: hypothetical protein LBQ44_02775 [Treponema sp.]|jgi:hypothetical protein|nr:hypothetical protein [Treponema sp.]